jgi:hypothetical protein
VPLRNTANSSTRCWECRMQRRSCRTRNMSLDRR